MGTEETQRERVKTLSENPRLTGESWENWRSDLTGLALGTQIAYLRNFVNFLERYNLTSQELYELAEEAEEKNGLEKAKIPNMVRDLQRELYESGKVGKKSSTEDVFLSVKSFLTGNYLSFNVPTQKRFHVDDTTRTPKITKDQVRRVLAETNDKRAIAIIHTAKDSGLRISDITDLEVRHFTNAKRIVGVDGETYLYFRFIPQKTRKHKQIADVILGFESTRAIEDWLNFRENYRTEEGESVLTTPKSPLFCAMKTRDRYKRGGKWISGQKIGDKVQDSNFGGVFKRLVRNAKIEADPQTGKTPSIHSLRSYHLTKLEGAEVPDNWIKSLQGRSGDDSSFSYSQPEIEELVRLYSKAYPHLSIEYDPASVDDLQKRVDQLESMNKYLWNLIDPDKKVKIEMRDKPTDDFLDVSQYAKRAYSPRESLDKTRGEVQEDKDQEITDLKKMLQDALNRIGELEKSKNASSDD